MLRENQEMDLGFFTAEQIQKFVQENEELEKVHGPLPLIYPLD